MPGAPNRPPEPTPAVPPSAPVVEPPERRALRRLAPSRVALLLDLWKGAPSPDLLGPYDRAEAAFGAEDYPTCLQALDLLSVRLHEPRWPSLPVPFRPLRVAIPHPQPPSWDPDQALPATEREARRARREAEEQVGLARASVEWAGAHQVPVGDWPARIDAAAALLATGSAPSEIYAQLDPLWEGVRQRLPHPRAPAGRPASPPPDAGVI